MASIESSDGIAKRIKTNIKNIITTMPTTMPIIPVVFFIFLPPNNYS